MLTLPGGVSLCFHLAVIVIRNVYKAVLYVLSGAYLTF